MLKKTIISAMLSAALFAGAPASANIAVEPESSYTEVSAPGDQTNAEGERTNGAEANTVQESELTRKAIQAEKAKNAEENDSFGGAITIIAMTIVVSALAILCLLFFLFGKVSSAIHTHNKRKSHGVTPDTAEGHHDETDFGEAIAAISMALAEHAGQGHDMEDTILTIRRMKKEYTPWNSKIYNMRVFPAQEQHPRRKL